VKTNEQQTERSAGFPGGVSDLNLVIHDLKNSVGVLLLLLDVSRRAGKAGEAARLAAQLIEVIRRLRTQLDQAEAAVSAERGARNGSVPLTERVAPDQVVNYVAAVHAQVVPANVRVVTELTTSLPPVAMAGVDLERCLGNLLKNAVEALGADGGTVTVRAHPAAGGRGVVISVTDTGCGLAPEVLGQPGFTTKPNGHGLGLASVRALVGAAGTLSIASVPGQGTTVTLVLE
jgi:signal transduction histidine kinase